MIIDLKGRRAVVTGSTAGIGRATAEGLARAGATVVINGRGSDRVDKAVQEMREALPDSDISGIAADLSTTAGAEAFVAQADDADILVNNLGTAWPKPFGELTDDDWLKIFPNQRDEWRPHDPPLSAAYGAQGVGTRRVRQQRVRGQHPQGND